MYPDDYEENSTDVYLFSCVPSPILLQSRVPCKLTPVPPAIVYKPAPTGREYTCHAQSYAGL